MTYIDQIINAVGDIPRPEHEGHERDFVNVMFSLLACALAKLPADEREECLRDIEDALRAAVAMYPNAQDRKVLQ
jgi:hypothetical protein